MEKLGIYKIDKIYQENSIELMKDIPSNSIDLIFAVSPYNLQLNNELYRPNQTKVDAVMMSGINLIQWKTMIILRHCGCKNIIEY